VNKNDTKEVLLTHLLQRYPGSEKYASVGALVNIKWSDSNKGGFFCNTDLAFLVISVTPIYSPRRRLIRRPGTVIIPGVLSSHIRMPLLKLNPFMISSNDSKPNILLPVHPILTPPTPQQIGNYTLDDLNSMYKKYKRQKHILL
jgi:hypothetical protein